MEPAIVSSSKYSEDHLPGPNGSMSIAEIDRVFRGLVENPTRRSVASVLRITREQLKARKTFSGIPSALVMLLGPLVVAGLAVPLLPAAIRPKVLVGVAGWAILTLFALFYAWRFRHSSARAKTDEQRIRVLAVDALATLASLTEVKQEGLDHEERGQLTKLLRSTPSMNAELLRLFGQ